MWDVVRSTLRLANVGGMDHVKEQLDLAFLAPMRNPELKALYAKSLRGGLLLYGPPGCGKSYLARAVAGELGASFVSIAIHDVLDIYVGASERNLHDLFQTARRNAPCVLFMDEVDALGQRRTQLRHAPGMRSTVNQLLAELDGATQDNEGVFLLAATNHPWDVDPALRRPGRLDRIIFVPPPDVAARGVIFGTHLAERPLEDVDLAGLARASDGLSGADIAHVCETAAAFALRDAVRTGSARSITMKDLKRALREVAPSTGAWFDVARNIVAFGNASAGYDDLRDYMKARRLL
jgi:SpoVK/Ycf46/Vps4 family AAA+-type ATPase